MNLLSDFPAANEAAAVWLRQILDNSTAVVYVKDRTGRNLFVNRRYLDVFHMGEADVIGRTDEQIFPAEIAAGFRRNDERVFARNAPIEFEERAQTPDGERIYLSIKFPLRDAQGAPYAVCGISTDITERTRIEQALRNVALGVTGSTGQDIFQSIARHLAASLGVSFAFIGKLIDSQPQRIQTLAVCNEGRCIDNLQYDLCGTPCQNVIGQTFQFVPQGICTQYPGDNMLSRMGFESYAGYPLFDSQGRALGLIAALHSGPMREPEFTEAILKIFSVRAASELERLRAEEASCASEASYRAIFEASEDAIFVHDIATGAIVDVNPKACRAYGYSYEEMLCLDVGTLSSGEHPYTLAEAAKYIEKARAGDPQRIEWRRRNKDGSLHWDEVLLHRATIGGVERIVAFTREISERKAIEAALRASEEQYRSIFNSSVDGLLLCSPEGRIVDANPAFGRLLGFAREQLIGLEPVRLMSPGSEAAYQAFVDTAGAGRTFHLETRALHRDGTPIDVEVHGVQVHYRERPHLLAIIRDITERKLAEVERNRLETQLRQAQKMEAIGQLSGGIAHDFNNILTGVMGYIVLAQERTESSDDAKLKRYLERAQRSGQRARDLIQQMLTFSRGQRGEPRSLLLAPLIKETVKLLGATLPSSVEFVTCLDTDAPAALLDPVQVEQILMNLCINARDAMQGSGRIEVRLGEVRHTTSTCASCRQSIGGRYLELSVSDSGPGIPADVQDRMFEPFFSTKEVGKGSGMGLATVHGIVHEYGGHVLVESVPGEGARFRILFPPLDSANGAAAALQPQTANTQRGPVLAGRVLVVDDDEAAGDFMGDLLETWGLDVKVSRDSFDALEQFRRQPQAIDLAVLDQTMPRMKGLELVRELRSLRPDLPMILYSGYSEGITEEELNNAGVSALIRKPVDTDELRVLLRRLLSANR